MKSDILRTAIKKNGILGITVITIEIITYTFSFLVSGIAKKDIFNILEGQGTTLHITSLNLLILLNIAVPLLINCVKQVNTGMINKFSVRLKRNVKTAALEASWHTRGTYRDGEVLSLFRNECEDIVAYFLEFYNQLPKIALSIAILIIMLRINFVFAIVSLLPTVIMTAAMRILTKRITENRQASRAETGRITAYTDAVLENAEYFKMLRRKDRIYTAYQERCKKRAAWRIKDRIFEEVLAVFSANAANLTLGIVLLIAIPLFKTGIFTVGEFVMFEYYYAFLASLPDAVGALLRRRKQVHVALERMQVLWDRKEAIEGTASYDGENLQIMLQDGIRLQGKNGRMIRLQPNDGDNPFLWKIFQICQKSNFSKECVYIPKEPVLLEGSLQENICMGEMYNEEKFRQVLQKTDLSADVRDWQEGVQKNVGKKGQAVSGGQRKRIAIARALYAEAPIILADGLTEQLDRHTGAYMLSELKENFQGILIAVSDDERIETA